MPQKLTIDESFKYRICTLAEQIYIHRKNFLYVSNDS